MKDKQYSKKAVKSSAPGKAMILGDHGAVYGYPCLAAAINRRVYTGLEALREKAIILESKNIGIKTYKKKLTELEKGYSDKNSAFVETAIFHFKNKYGLDKGLRITTDSKAVAGYGLGSSSAVTVSLLLALCRMNGISLNSRQLFELAKGIVLNVQKSGSGYDVASAVYGGIIYYEDKGRVIQNLEKKNIPLMLIYTGEKADTVGMINLVKKKMGTHRKAVLKIFETISEFTCQAKEAIKRTDWPSLGKYMNFSQDYLEDLGISTSRINSIIKSVRDAGALGAKLSGAGGGDCVIVLFDQSAKRKMIKAAEKAGGQIIQADICWQGALNENN